LPSLGNLSGNCIESLSGQYTCGPRWPRSISTPVLMPYFILLAALCSWHFGAATCNPLLLDAGLPRSLAVQVAISLSNPIKQENPRSNDRTNSVTASRLLYGSGFHRTLQQTVAVGSSSSADACQLATVQHLPSSYFVDPYQLEDLARKEAGLSFELLGPLDLEL
jgi:hypothetical protein